VNRLAEGLGAIPSLFNKPNQYARFLGFELSAGFIGPLLIVMPSGFGIWDGRAFDRRGAARARDVARDRGAWTP